MKNTRYLILAAIITAAVSCTGSLDNGPGAPIEFSVGIETRAFLDSEDINVAGTEMCLWGYEDAAAFIPGVSASYTAAKGWTLAENFHWTDGKSYAFFSYLTKDKDGNASPVDLTMSGRTLTHPVRAFNFAEGDNNFDFCYSDVVYRPASPADHSVVNLHLKHLYAAVAFSAQNYTDKTITVYEVSLVGLKNRKSASINFADGGAEVTYGNATTWDGSRKLNGGNITLDPGVECANIVGVASTTPQYYMFWPQTSSELTAGGWTDSERQPSGGAYLKIVYMQDGREITRYARFPQDNDGTNDLGWTAGKKRMMRLSFRDNWVTVNMAALPWDYSEPTIKYDDEVTVAQPLQFDGSTCTIDETEHKIFFNTLSSPVTGRFRLSAPSEATWIISKEGDYDAFEIDDTVNGRYGDGLDCNYGTVDVVGGNSFTLYPKAVGSGRDYSIQLTFSVRYPDGESYCIDDKIQPAGKWTIIFTK